MIYVGRSRARADERARRRAGTPGKIHVYLQLSSESVPTHRRTSFQGMSFQGPFMAGTPSQVGSTTASSRQYRRKQSAAPPCAIGSTRQHHRKQAVGSTTARSW